MAEKLRSLSRYLSRNELRINLILALASLFILTIGLALNSGIIVGPSLLLLIFFSTYVVFAYVRRDR
jgi:hypothetical protein